jgi:hypothetical protein
MNRFDELCQRAPLEPPASPRLDAVERRARHRSLRLNTVAATSVLAVAVSTLWLTRQTGVNYVAATADQATTAPTPTSTTPTSTIEQAVGDIASGSAANAVLFSAGCSAQVRVYNASGRAGVAGELTDTATNAIATDPTLSGSMLEPTNAAIEEDAITWVLDEGAECADLARLGLPAPSGIEWAPDPARWADIDFGADDIPRIAIILGTSYQP